MAILCVSPEGAMQQVSTTEAETLKKLGWTEMSYDEFYAKAKAKNAPKQDIKPIDSVDESAMMEAQQPARRVGRPRKEDSEVI